MRASTLFAVTPSCTANTGTSQNVCALSASYTGFGFTGEYQGGTDSMHALSCTISKNKVFKAALCRVKYFWKTAVLATKNPPITRGGHVRLQFVSCQCHLTVLVCTGNNFQWADFQMVLCHSRKVKNDM